MKSLKIIVAFHGAVTHSECFQDPEYFVPVYGGRATTLHAPNILKEMQGDDEDENISWTNPYIGELTCLYWAWKHLDKLGNPERIGLNHYRRLFPIRAMEKELEEQDDKNYILTTTKMFGFPVVLGAEAVYGIGGLVTETLAHVIDKGDEPMANLFLSQPEYAEKNLFIIPTKELDNLMPMIERAVNYLTQYFKLHGYPGAAYVRSTARVMEFITAFFLFKLSRTGYTRLVTKYEYPWKGFA